MINFKTIKDLRKKGESKLDTQTLQIRSRNANLDNSVQYINL